MSLYEAQNDDVRWRNFHEIRSDLISSGHFDNEFTYQFIQSESCFEERELPCPISKGTDFWGGEIHFLKGEGMLEWILRSPGPNKVDDGGSGDDMDEVVHLGYGMVHK